MKPERVQNRSMPVTPDRLREANLGLRDWEVDPTPNAITRHFPQPSFAASVKFLTQVSELVETHGTVPFVTVSRTGVTIRLGSPPETGVNKAELELADALMGAA
ncbi:MAG: hypothetical protein GY719_25195 [bacterium]|nr:hypothetical protein [bacterium]